MTISTDAWFLSQAPLRQTRGRAAVSPREPRESANCKQQTTRGTTPRTHLQRAPIANLYGGGTPVANPQQNLDLRSAERGNPPGDPTTTPGSTPGFAKASPVFPTCRAPRHCLKLAP